MSLWKKDMLCALLRAGETAWDFEIHGSHRSDAYDGFFRHTMSFFLLSMELLRASGDDRCMERFDL